MNTTNGRKLSADAQEALRMRVVRAIVGQGLTQTEAVETFRVGRSSIHGWLKKYHLGGFDALKAGGPGNSLPGRRSRRKL